MDSTDEIVRLAERSLFILRFTYAGASGKTSQAEFEEGIQRTLEARSLRGMKEIHRYMCLMAAQTLSAADRTVLEKQLQEKWGQGLGSGKKRKDPTGALDIAARGVQTEAEFELVAKRVVKIEQDPGSADEIDTLDRAMLAYQQKTR